MECRAVLGRCKLNAVLAAAQIMRAVDDLMLWPPRSSSARLFAGAWRMRANRTLPDVIYIALADHLRAELVTGDSKLVATPNVWGPLRG